MKCDLHVHSLHSGNCNIPFLNGFCRESYNDPERVYQTLRRKGMDLVTLTDHDSIDGAEALRRYPNFFLSEEVTCRMPSGTSVHVGVYDLSERQHIEIQRRRNDLLSLLAYLSEARLFFSVNHLFSALTGRRHAEDFFWFEEYFPAFETLNGQMSTFHNGQARQHAQRMRKIGVGGSDAHAMASLASSYTEVRGARNKIEFFSALRAGRGTAAGTSGGYLRLTRDIFAIARDMIREKPRTAVLAPLVAILPLATLATVIHDAAFARRLARNLRRQEPFSLLGERICPANELAERFA